MLASLPKCGVATIPSRLHTCGRRKAPAVDQDDRVFIRHEPLPLGEGYGLCIPGHEKLEDQSANSELINSPNGYACDVLFDCKNGNHHIDFHFACIDVSRVHEFSIPNENTIRMDRHGAVIQDTFTFEVVHTPTTCMYPHCEILAKKNGVPPKKVAAGIKTTVRTKFADLAEFNRLEMIERRAKEFPQWNKELRRREFVVSMMQKLNAFISFLSNPVKRFLRRISGQS